MAYMDNRTIIVEGHSKIVYPTDDEDYITLHFKDTASAFHNIKRATITGKGALTNKISARLFQVLRMNGIESHFKCLAGDCEQVCRKVQVLPLRVIVRNVAAGSLVGRLGLHEGMVLQEPVLEMTYKNDALDNPFINRHHAVALSIATRQELDGIYETAGRVNDVLGRFFSGRGISLVDYKLEFGRANTGEIFLADEISPDTCRLWDMASGYKLDKDRFRRDMGDIIEAYTEVYKRVTENED